MKQRSKLKNLAAYLLSLILLLASVVLIFDIVKGQLETATLRTSLKEVQAQLQELQEENNLLIQQKDKLNDPEYIKNYARGQYMLSQENEQIFRLPGSDD